MSILKDGRFLGQSKMPYTNAGSDQTVKITHALRVETSHIEHETKRTVKLFIGLPHLSAYLHEGHCLHY